MKNYRKHINVLRDETAGLQQELQQLFSEVGGVLRENHPSLCEQTEAHPHCEEYERAEEALFRNQETKTRIAAIQSRIEALRQEAADGHSESKHLQQEAAAVYPDIGRRSFEIFHDNTYLEAEYAERFSEISAAQKEVDRLQSELNEQEALLESKPFLDRIVTRGRVVLLKNRVSGRIEAMEKQYRKLGETIVESEFIREVNDEELNRVAEPYCAANRRISDISDRAAQLEKERKELESELSELCNGRRPGKVGAEIDEDIRSLLETQHNALAQFARSVRELLSEEMQQLVGKQLERVAALEANVAQKQDHIARLEAALEVERLDAEIGRINGDIAAREREIEAAEKRKGELTESRAELEHQRSEQEAKRGDPKDL